MAIIQRCRARRSDDDDDDDDEQQLSLLSPLVRSLKSDVAGRIEEISGSPGKVDSRLARESAITRRRGEPVAPDV